MIVLDASAALAFLTGEPGADLVAELVAEHAQGAVMGAASWSEVALRVPDPVEWPLASAVLEAMGVTVEPVTRADAEAAARLAGSRPGLSLGDRLCLALGERLGATVLTADRAWGDPPGVRQLR